MADIEIDEWHNLYGSRWGGEITPESVAHPAKFNRKLIERIYRHAVDEGWLTPGSTVIDPFGGIALGAFPAMRLGMRWIGVELEPRFVMMGNSNLDLWNYRYAGKLPGWGSARLIRGDSRQMVALLAKYAAPDLQGACNGEATAKAVASPPFGQSLKGGGIVAAMRGEGSYKVTTSMPANAYTPEAQGVEIGNLSAMPTGDVDAALAVSSPPFTESLSSGRMSKKMLDDFAARGHELGAAGQAAEYGAEPGQLAGMPAGDVDLAVSSPPFLQVSGGAGVKPGVAPGSILADPRMLARHSAGNPTAKGYGEDPASLTNKPVGDFDAAIASPSYADARAHPNIRTHVGERGRDILKRQGLTRYYGAEDGQLGSLPVGDADAAAPADTFWAAARDIVAQTFAVLRPGGHAIWVCKGYVKGGKLVDFPDQWRRLCEAAGFVTVHLHKAMVVEDKGTQKALHGEDKHYKAEHKSFFRRDAEKKGAPRIDFETVLCMVKPE